VNEGVVVATKRSAAVQRAALATGRPAAIETIGFAQWEHAAGLAALGDTFYVGERSGLTRLALDGARASRRRCPPPSASARRRQGPRPLCLGTTHARLADERR